MEIDGGGFYRGVAEELADRVEVIAFVQKVGGKTMPEGVGTALFGYAGFFLAASKTYQTETEVICESFF